MLYFIFALSVIFIDSQLFERRLLTSYILVLLHRRDQKESDSKSKSLIEAVDISPPRDTSREKSRDTIRHKTKGDESVVSRTDGKSKISRLSEVSELYTHLKTYDYFYQLMMLLIILFMYCFAGKS